MAIISLIQPVFVDIRFFLKSKGKMPIYSLLKPVSVSI